MSKAVAVLISCLIMIACFTPSSLAPTIINNQVTVDFDTVFEDIIADYSLFTSLMQDVYPLEQYRISTHGQNSDSVVAYLRTGFSVLLAQAIVGEYMQYLPKEDKMAIIPTDSIPVITSADKEHLTMQQISPNKVILKRSYTNCYAVGDHYLYCITAQKQASRWIIEDLKMESI